MTTTTMMSTTKKKGRRSSLFRFLILLLVIVAMGVVGLLASFSDGSCRRKSPRVGTSLLREVFPSHTGWEKVISHFLFLYTEALNEPPNPVFFLQLYYKLSSEAQSFPAWRSTARAGPSTPFSHSSSSPLLSIPPPDWKEKIGEEISAFAAQVQKGKHLAAQESIVLCGLVRDQDKRIEILRENIGRITSFFSRYKIIILENNSKDKTREYLLQWSREDSHVIVLCNSATTWNQPQCDLSHPLFSWSRYDKQNYKYNYLPQRTVKMAVLRNILVDTVKTHFSDYSKVMMMDMDVDGTLFPSGIFHSLLQFQESPDIDAISANGVIGHLPSSATGEDPWDILQLFHTHLQGTLPFLYYDSFAYAEMRYSSTSWGHYRYKSFHDQYVHNHVTKKYLQSTLLDRVRSAFGGCTIYRILPFVSSKYQVPSEDQMMVIGSEEKTEQPPEHSSSSELSTEDRFSYVSCEHISFHKSMKIVVNPQFVYYIRHND